ncbi:MAG: RCC1 domain-containing protein, partial [Polyangiales bacterium]
FCWGRNSLGELGGEPAENDPFVRVPKVDDAVSVHAGDGYSCALRAAGTMACWGNGHDVPGGYEGGKYPVVTTKEPVSYLRLASGMHFRCRLTTDAKVECTGDNKHGQLGNGTTENAYAKTMVLGITDAVAVTAGFDHACAAKADDTVYCWGANDQAQIGDGTLGDRRFATKVIGLGGSEPAPPPKPGSGPPIVVPMAKSATASWREPDSGLFRAIGSRYHSYDAAPDAVGMKVALFKSRGLLLDEAHGLVPVTFPSNATWLGLDGNDAIYAGTKDSLLRADDVDAAKKNTWKKVLAVPYAVDFEATKGLVVAAQAKTLHVSTDGKTFVAKNLKIDLSIEKVFARPDVVGVLGHDASGESTLYLSKDQGSSFTKSSFQADRFSQVGSAIWASGCPGAVLSADGLTWRKREDYGYSPTSFGGWGGALRLSAEPHAFFSEKLANLVEPPPPPVPTGADVATGKPGKCSGGAGGIGFGGGRYRNPGACMGVECVRGSIGEEAKSTKTEVGFFGDGMCARDEKGYCKKDAPWVRAPHVSVGGTMASVPAGCDPERVLSAGGIGVLFCAKSKTDFDLHTIDKSAKWNAEGTVSFAGGIDDVTVATDGTMVVHPVCPAKGKESEPCAPALVRKPVALGTSGAWRSTTTPRALSYRVLTGGEVLVIAQTAANDVTKFDLVIEKPAGKAVLASGIGVADDLIDLAIEADRIVVTQRMSSRPPTKSYVAKDGVVPIVEEPKIPAEPPIKKKPVF